MGNVSLLDEHKKKKRNPPDHLVPSGFSAHPAGFEPTACRLGVFVGRVPWRSPEIVKALWIKDGGRFTVRLSLHFST